MISPQQLGLPYDKWQKNQWEAITAILGSQKQIVVLELPVGAGKSGVAVGLTRILAKQGHPSFYLTSTKQLQQQYMELPGMIQLKGRNNFECLIDPTVTAEEAECTVGYRCPYAGIHELALDGCKYWIQRRAALGADDVTINYAYALRQWEIDGLEYPKTLILDEAHALFSHIEAQATLALRTRDINQLGILNVDMPTGEGIESPQAVNKYGLTYPVTFEQIHLWAERNKNKLRMAYDELREKNGNGGLSRGDRQFAKSVQNLYDVSNKVLAADGEWIVQSQNMGWDIRPVWIKSIAPRFLLRPNTRLVFMSGTILDKDLFLEVLGLDQQDSDFFRFPSTFPVANRPLFYWPVAKVLGKTQEGYPEVAAAVDTLLEKHPTEKGLVHTVSYGLAKYILENTRYPGRFITHDGKDRESKLAMFRNTTEPKVLISPSMGTGVDLPDDLCRWNVICKLPFPDLGDPVRKAQRDTPLGKRLMTYDTAAALVQTYGRAMRSETDFGETWILDANFGWWRRMAAQYLPSYFTEAIQTVRQ